MERMLIIHLAGSKAGSTQQFPLGEYTALSIGRSSSCEVQFSEKRDPLVSRLHAKIESVSQPRRLLRITDLGSRNGTFVNDAPVQTSVDLSPGDVIRLGPRGPVFMVDVHPRAAQPRADISRGKGTVVRGFGTFFKGFVDYEEKKGALSLFVRIFMSPMRETMRVALRGDRANPFKFLAIGSAFFTLTGIKVDPMIRLDKWFPILAGQPWIIEVVETACFLGVMMLFAVFQYKMLQSVSPERRRFRHFLVLSALVSGMLFFLMSIGRIAVFFLVAMLDLVWPAMGLLLAIVLYWAIQSVRIAKVFWGVSYPKLLWYYVLSGAAVSLVCGILIAALETAVKLAVST